MTREEASFILANIDRRVCDDELSEALDMAIKALEQEPVYFPPCVDCNTKMNEIREAYDKLKNQEPCEDAISREEAFEALNSLNGTSELDKAFEVVEKLPSVTPTQEPRWIPVSEMLPEEFESVLVCYKSQGGMAQAVSERFGTHTGYRWSALAGIKPIAWMPLPEHYKAESE